MVTNSFIYKKMENAIAAKRKSGKRVCIGFVRRNTEDIEEIYAHPELLCDDYVFVDPLRLTLNYTSDKIVFRILFDNEDQDRDEQIRAMLNIKSSLEDDLENYDSQFWRVLIMERICKSLYEFDLLSINFLPNHKGAAIVCTIRR